MRKTCSTNKRKAELSRTVYIGSISVQNHSWTNREH